jgi:serine phosphatase RsbU (regulator of sigma subunit)
VDLEAGDILLLYTDGLTDAALPAWGEAELAAHMRACPSENLSVLLTQLEARAVRNAGEHPRDDIALLALRPVSG